MMYRKILMLLVTITLIPLNQVAAEHPLDAYIRSYNYQSRKEMKITSKELLAGIERGEIQLIDIRFVEEHLSWSFGAATNIPLPELPNRLKEINKNRVIVTACPHKDRAIIAMVFLRSRGYKARYLQDGLTGLAEHLRGDKARAFILNQKKMQK